MPGHKLSFKAFLSHRYKSPGVNLYFFDVFKQIAEVQFEADEGTSSTNVTRLERMIRNADAFIGIYPFPGSAEEGRTPEELKKQSRYFRLEIDLAIRSQKPAIIFYDQRYGDLLKPPADVFSYPFDIDEVTGTGGFPSFDTHKRVFKIFCEAVASSKQYDNVFLNSQKTKVALFLPRRSEQYNAGCIDTIKQAFENNNYSDVVMLQYPFALDTKLFRLLAEIDFAVVDMSDTIALTGVPAYLHGRFIPSIRLRYEATDAGAEISPIQHFLYGGVEVGYLKDTIVWNEVESLGKQLSDKLKNINTKVNRINTNEEAVVYFNRAALRKEAVFLSYSGKDVEIAGVVSNTLKKHFQTVFDYKDGSSIRPGQPWLEEIFRQLSTSAIGVSLLSQSYLESGNCVHELQEMVASRDSKKLLLLPVKLYDDALELPSYLGNIQYLKRSNFADTDAMTREIIALLSPALK